MPPALHSRSRLPSRVFHSIQSIITILLACLLLSACKKPEEKKKASSRETAPPAPKLLFIPDEAEQQGVDLSSRNHPASGVTLDQGGTPIGKARGGACPNDMVLVDHSYCVDRFEVHLLDVTQARLLSPHYPPSKRYTQLLSERWERRAPQSKGLLGLKIPVPGPPEFQFIEDFEPRAQSTQGVLPAGYLTRGLAEMACKNAGKRLCTRSEWVKACRGDQDRKYPYGDRYEAMACNVNRHHHPAQLLHGNASRHHLDPRLNLTEDEDGPLLRRTGSTEACVSTWGDDGIYDMVGNLDEWIFEPEGSFLGGFYSRATKEGCHSSIDSHDPGYLDYSLGTRCCRDRSL